MLLTSFKIDIHIRFTSLWTRLYSYIKMSILKEVNNILVKKNTKMMIIPREVLPGNFFQVWPKQTSQFLLHQIWWGGGSLRHTTEQQDCRGALAQGRGDAGTPCPGRVRRGAGTAREKEVSKKGDRNFKNQLVVFNFQKVAFYFFKRSLVIKICWIFF